MVQSSNLNAEKCYMHFDIFEILYANDRAANKSTRIWSIFPNNSHYMIKIRVLFLLKTVVDAIQWERRMWMRLYCEWTNTFMVSPYLIQSQKTDMLLFSLSPLSFDLKTTKINRCLRSTDNTLEIDKPRFMQTK